MQLRSSNGEPIRRPARGMSRYIYDESACAMLEDTVRRVKHSDPEKGRWDVIGEDATVWMDASSLTLGIVIEVDGHVVEDASWLRSEDSFSQINMAELNAVIRGSTRHFRGR